MKQSVSTCKATLILRFLSIRPTVDFGPYIATFKTYYIYADTSTNESPGHRHRPHADIPGSERRNDERVERPECQTGLTLTPTLSINSNPNPNSVGHSGHSAFWLAPDIPHRIPHFIHRKPPFTVESFFSIERQLSPHFAVFWVLTRTVLRCCRRI